MDYLEYNHLDKRLCFSLMLQQYPFTTIILFIVTYLSILSIRNWVCVTRLSDLSEPSCAKAKVILSLWRHTFVPIHVRHAIFHASSASILWHSYMKILLRYIQSLGVIDYYPALVDCTFLRGLCMLSHLSLFSP